MVVSEFAPTTFNETIEHPVVRGNFNGRETTTQLLVCNHHWKRMTHEAKKVLTDKFLFCGKMVLVEKWFFCT